MNRPVRLLLAAGVLLATLLAGCGVRPSGVISGGLAPVVGTVGDVRLYLVYDGEPTVVLRGLKPHKLDEVLRVLAGGPNAAELRAGFTTEVPAAIAPVKISYAGDGPLVSLSTDVRGLSVLATLQIVCTVQGAMSDDAVVTLVSGEQRRGPLSCPVHP